MLPIKPFGSLPRVLNCSGTFSEYPLSCGQVLCSRKRNEKNFSRIGLSQNSEQSPFLESLTDIAVVIFVVVVVVGVAATVGCSDSNSAGGSDGVNSSKWRGGYREGSIWCRPLAANRRLDEQPSGNQRGNSSTSATNVTKCPSLRPFKPLALPASPPSSTAAIRNSRISSQPLLLPGLPPPPPTQKPTASLTASEEPERI